MRFINTIIVPSASINPTANGTPVESSQMLYATAQVVTSGGSSPSFTVKLQGSNDIPPNFVLPSTFTPSHWADIPNATVTVAANGTQMIPKSDICFRYIRAVVTYTSGTGTVAVTLFGICV